MSGWFYARQGKTLGPFSWDQLRALARQGGLRADDHVYEEGLGKWVHAGSVGGLFDAVAAPRSAPASAPPPPQTAVQPAPPRRAAVPLPARSATPAPAAVEESRNLGQRLLALPKPVLFGLCGAAGGLLAALLVGELCWFLLRPASVNIAPQVQLAVPEDLSIYAGGKNHFAVKVTRRGFEGPIQVDLEGAPAGVHAAAVTIAPGRSEAELVVRADGPLAAGKHRFQVRARVPSDKTIPAATRSLELHVAVPPPSLRLAVSSPVAVQQGGKARFGVKVARANFTGPVALDFQGAPREVVLTSTSVPADQDGTELEVSVPRSTPAGLHVVRVAGAAGEVRDRTSFSLDVRPAPVPKVDVVFVLDLTASMQFAIDGVKNGIGNFVDQLGKQRVDARFGLVAFRDIVADKERPFALKFAGETFTTNVPAFRDEVQRLKADGGGDAPESSLQAVGLAAQQPFRADASRVLVLITDAPPKVHPQDPPVTPEDAAALLQRQGINQVHLVVRPDDYRSDYRVLQRRPLHGTMFDIQSVLRGDAFASLLPKLGEEISNLTIASLPAAPGTAAPPPLPATGTPELPAAAAPTLQAVQSTEAFAEAQWGRLVLALAVWTATVAAGVSLLIVGGQHYYLRRSSLTLAAAAQALAGGLLAGLLGGAVAQLVAFAAGGAVSKFIGWSVLGGLLGGGLALFVPNLKWSRGLGGGLAGGLLGALTFLVISAVVGDLLGRWIGAAVLGFCIGLMVALAELAFRRWWLEITFSAREVRTVTLGAAAVSVGGDERRVSVFVPGAPPLALRYRVEGNRVLCEDVATGRSAEVATGATHRFGNVTVTVCSPASARQSGYRLVLTGGRSVLLGEGMPLTADDLPGLEPQAADGVVALVSRRPSAPQVLLLRNRSRQAWVVRKTDGTQQQIGPGLGVELGPELHIDFGGGPQGRVLRSAELD